MALAGEAIASLGARKAELAQALVSVDASCQLLRLQEEQLKVALDARSHDKYRALLATTRQQRTARRLEDLEAGRYRPAVETPEAGDAELARAAERQAKIVALLGQLKASSAGLAGDVERILCHVGAQ
jgi:hypothetical protein